jgi:crotonobetainyl-CoA:carnitine CoA-transferase CaiB-like acyl-CoA transferase
MTTNSLPQEPHCSFVPTFVSVMFGSYGHHGAMPFPADVAEADLAGVGRRLGIDVTAVLDERRRLGTVPDPRPCRLVEAADGWVAVNLARPSDVDLVPAWLRREPASDDPWAAIAEGLATEPAVAATTRAQELGLPVATVVPPDHEDDQTRHRHQRFPMAPFVVDGQTQATRAMADPAGVRVVDLTALWAGPLATAILADAGCAVTKVESTSRPDGARAGDPRFFAALNRGKEELTLDFATAPGRAALARLCGAADVVVTASRPRAIAQLGLDADGWPLHVSITGYGWTGPWAHRVAFGDDAGAAGGLAALSDPPRLVGDAVADPVAGLYAAAATLGALAAGFRGRIDVALRDAANHVAREGVAVLEPAPR